MSDNEAYLAHIQERLGCKPHTRRLAKGIKRHVFWGLCVDVGDVPAWETGIDIRCYLISDGEFGRGARPETLAEFDVLIDQALRERVDQALIRQVDEQDTEVHATLMAYEAQQRAEFRAKKAHDRKVVAKSMAGNDDFAEPAG